MLFSLIGHVSAATMNNIQALDANTIELEASSEVVFSDSSIESDIKILKDIKVSFSAKDAENPKKVILNL
jgi:hypothetical protein